MNNFEKSLLLSKNPKALQFLHVAAGFDFQAPHTISRIAGKFTARTVNQCIPEGHAAALLLERVHAPNDRFDSRLIYVRFNGYKFQADRVRGLPHWDYNLDELWSVGGFEEIRKHKTANLWIVTQDPAHFIQQTPRELETDEFTRYNLHEWYPVGDGHGGTYIRDVRVTRMGHNEKPFEMGAGIRAATVADIIDKSGYNVNRARFELGQRLRKYKTEKAENALKNHDFTAEYAAVVEKLEAARGILMERTKNAAKWADWKNIEEIAFSCERCASWLDTFRDRLDRGSLRNISQAQSILHAAVKYVEKVVGSND